MTHVTPAWLRNKIAKSSLLREMRPEHWEMATPPEITHILKEIFRRIAVEERWTYFFEKPRKHDFAAWLSCQHWKERRPPLLVLESENLQKFDDICHELRRLVESKAELNVGIFYMWEESYSKNMIIREAQKLIKEKRPKSNFLIMLGYTMRNKERQLKAYGYETYAIEKSGKAHQMRRIPVFRI